MSNARRGWRVLLGGAALALSLAAGSPVAAAEQVDIELVLAVDVSLSMSPTELAIQREYADILNGVIKSVVFGVAVTAIALFEGYDSPPTAEGVSHATTRTVVTSSLAILGLDFVLTAFMFRGA